MDHSNIDTYKRELAAELLPLSFADIAYNKKRLAEFRALAVALGLEVDMNCTKCNHDLKKEIKSIMAKTEKKPAKKVANKFKMKEGIYITSLGFRLDSGNMTDAQAKS